MIAAKTPLSAALLAAALMPAVALLPKPAAAQPQPDGAALYQSKCGGCHSIAANRIGPAHKGLFGRKAGTVPGYQYSPALKASRIVWNDKTLDRWLSGPQRMVSGSTMYIAVPDKAERAAIIGYLKSASRK